MLVPTRMPNEQYTGSNCENTEETMTANYDADMKTTDVEKIKNLLEQTFKGEANNMQSEAYDTEYPDSFIYSYCLQFL